MYWEYYLLGIILIPGIILSLCMQAKVTSTYKKYSHVLGSKRLTGAEVAKMVEKPYIPATQPSFSQW